MQERNERLIGVGLVLGVVLILLFVGMSGMLGQTSGFYGLPPRANGFVH